MIKKNFTFRNIVSLGLIFLLVCLCKEHASAQLNDTLKAIIERKAAGINAIIKKNAKVEVIADGFEWAEGPVWIESKKMLLVSDVLKNRIYKWTAQKGKELYLDSSGDTQTKPRGEELGSNGLAVANNDRLILCQHGDRRIAIMNASLDHPKSSFTTLAGSYNGKKFNSPNDLAIKSNGDIYFTDPPYGLEKGVDDPVREMPYHGVYKVSANGEVTLLTGTLTCPNGIAFFPGEKKLLIANSDPLKPYWYVYDVNKQGLLSNGKIFFDGTSAYQKENRTPDGIKIDNKGNVFIPGPGGVWILNKEGAVLGRIKVNVITSNCSFANNFKTLFITADNYLLKIDMR